MNESVERQLYEIIAKQSGIDVATIAPQSTLKDLGVDSLTAIETIFEIEEHFGVTLPDRDPNFDTDSVQGLATALQQALDGAAAAPDAA